MVRIGLIAVNSERLWRDGLAMLLEGSGFILHPDPETVLSDVETFAAVDPHAMFLYLERSYGPSCADWISEVRRKVPAARIVVIASELRMSEFVRAMEAGADGYLTENISGRALIRSLELVMAGEKVMPSSLSQLISRSEPRPVAVEAPATCPLSDRETDILRRLAQGESNKMIANGLKLAESTVKGNIKLILRKIAASNRTQAAIWAIHNGLQPDRLRAS
jgi:two-component system, NarL family, nitrate/nitrite response regulator NarL